MYRICFGLFLTVHMTGCLSYEVHDWRDKIWKIDYLHLEVSSEILHNVDIFFGAELEFKSCPDMGTLGGRCDFLVTVEGESFSFHYSSTHVGAEASIEILTIPDDPNRGDVYKKLRSLLTQTFTLEWIGANYLIMRCDSGCRATYQGRIYKGITIAVSRAP